MSHENKPEIDRRHMLGLMAGTALVAGTGTGPAWAQGAPKKGGVLRVASGSNPSSMDPIVGGSGNDYIFLYPVFSTLIEFEYDTLKAIPGLAERWSFPDPTTMVLDLRPGVLFHDGTPCDAQAVKFNLDRARTDERSNLKPDVASITGVEVTGPLQVTLKLSRPDSALLLTLSDRPGMMVSPKAVQELGRETDRKAVGAGPWKFVSWADNERLVVERNERYWKPGLPHLDGITFNMIAEVNTGLRSVTAGQNDFVYFLSPQQKPIVERSKNLNLVIAPTLYCWQIWLNFSRPPFDDARVRRAFNLGIDREALNKATMAGLAETAIMPVPTAHWAYDKSLANAYPYDPNKARALLAEAGHGNGLDIELFSNPDQRAVQRQEVLIEQLSKIGVKLRFNNAASPEVVQQFMIKRQGLGYLGASTGRPDPTLIFQIIYDKDSFYNPARIEPAPGIQDLLQATRASDDLDARKAAFSKLQHAIIENSLGIPLIFNPEVDAMSVKVKGYRANLLGKPKFEDVYLEG